MKPAITSVPLPSLIRPIPSHRRLLIDREIRPTPLFGVEGAHAAFFDHRAGPGFSMEPRHHRIPRIFGFKNCDRLQPGLGLALLGISLSQVSRLKPPDTRMAADDLLLKFGVVSFCII